MAKLRLEHIYKVYPNGVKAVNDFTMDIEDKEFIVFVGPSGCGKSTTLRMIAGLEDISAGELYIGDEIVNDVEPKDRDIAMVFQNYALYPHMTVYENMAFGLRLRHIPNEEIHERVMWAADILGLKEYLDRKPKAMSGGQRQRVALGRAILRNPKVMLLDEPLSNLDAKLRSQMRSEISKLHQRLGTTFIYVTHDQTEAMTLGSRVVVMKLGYVQQIDTPKNLYEYPDNKFVAGFIGTPQMNFFEGTLKKNGDTVEIKFEYSDAKLEVPYKNLIKVSPKYLNGDIVVTMGLRCEDISIEPEVVKGKKDLIDVKVSHFEELGNETLIYGDINMQGEGYDETATRVIIRATSRHDLNPGDVVKAYFNIEKLHLFDKETEETIKPRVPKYNLVNVSIKNNVMTALNTTFKLPKAMDVKVYEGELLIPSAALVVGGKDFEAKITDIEHINDINLYYLSVGDNTLFISTKEEYKVGQTLSIGIDFSLIDIKDKENTLAKAVPEFDDFKATFFNYLTIKGESEEIATKYGAQIAAKIEKINADLASNLEKVNQKYDELIAEANARDNTGLKAENKKLIAEKKAEIKTRLAEAKGEFKTKLAEVIKVHKENNVKIKQEVEEIYKKIIEDEKANYKEIISSNKDRDVINMAKQEHVIFKETTPKTKEMDLEKKLNFEGLRFDGEKGAVVNNFKRTKKLLNKELKEYTAKLNRETNLAKYLESDRKHEIAALNKEAKKALDQVNLIFFFKFDGNDKFYKEVPSIIATKLIQGLGSKVFSKIYQLRFPHDFIISDKGIECTVEGALDYGKRKYLLCKVASTGKEIYVETDRTIEIGSTIYVDVNLLTSQVIESGMNIRLY